MDPAELADWVVPADSADFRRIFYGSTVERRSFLISLRTSGILRNFYVTISGPSNSGPSISPPFNFLCQNSLLPSKSVLLKPMKIQILLFGIARDIVGKSRLELDTNQPLDVTSFKKLLKDKYPKMNHLSYFKVAINQEFADDHQILKEGDEVALIPPVSGGSC